MNRRIFGCFVALASFLPWKWNRKAYEFGQITQQDIDQGIAMKDEIERLKDGPSTHAGIQHYSSDEMRTIAKRIAQKSSHADDVDIDSWAKRIADDVADAND